LSQPNSATFFARTVAQPVALTGVGLHSGRQTTVRLCPAPFGSGLCFQRIDLPGQPTVDSREVAGDAPPFRTVLKRGAAEVHTVEHLFSALAAFQITDCRIEIDGLEVPGMDGSALPFAQALHEAGASVSPQHPIKPLVVREPLTVEEKNAKITVYPGPAALELHYTLDYPGHPRAQGSYSLTVTAESFLKEIAPARTFAIKRDAEAMLAAGLGQGANTQNTVIIDGQEVIETALRFDNEPVRHKMLDLIGDLYVLRRPVHGRIEARCSGHRLNRVLALKLLENEQA